MKMKMKQQSGFTLIELVMVIVILGILAAVAIPKYIDLSSDAKTSAIKAAAGALSSSSAINFAARMANSSAGISLGSNAGAALISQMGSANFDSSLFVISGSDVSCGTVPGATMSIVLSHSAGTSAVNSATATIICTG